ncbi:TfoX/Sxy family protein [Microvirga thermotolerans]|uniref:TfoX C-terminal domain-containing protein n=1 Tax=Microvirga thermotolerans TaxID=2651334 RepID=A0A5P9JTD4_9HYPH|nr:TfoX/Sxy family protein [Microvirga thermotolerans]QFU15379.1 hypothetical protein GDR74_03605 [Microvirga thermotolerans]
MDAAPVGTLPGIGPATQQALKEVGIETVADLRSLGAVEAYRRLKFMAPRRVSLNALYALEAALRGCHWLDLPSSVKTVLQDEARTIDAALRRGMSPRCRIG